MRIYTIYNNNGEDYYDIEADKLEFEWGTKTLVFLVDGEVIGAAADWEFVTSAEVE